MQSSSLSQSLSTSKLPLWGAWLILVLLSLIWGSSFILMKKSLLVFSSLQMGFLRVAVSFVVMLPVIGYYFFKIPSQKLFYLAISGMLGMAIPAVLFAIAQTRLDSSIAGVLNAVTPLCTLVVGLIFFQQKINIWQIFGLFLALFGAVALSVTGTLGQAGLNEYVFLVFLATICYALNVHLVKRYLSDIPPFVLTAMALWFAGLCASVGLLFVNMPSAVEKAGFAQAMIYVVVLSVGSTVIATTIFNFLIQQVSPLFASTVTYLIPIVALMWGIGDGELITFLQYASIACILGGLLMMNRKKV